MFLFANLVYFPDPSHGMPDITSFITILSGQSPQCITFFHAYFYCFWSCPPPFSPLWADWGQLNKTAKQKIMARINSSPLPEPYFNFFFISLPPANISSVRIIPKHMFISKKKLKIFSNKRLKWWQAHVIIPTFTANHQKKSRKLLPHKS
jgi:hypothetical protein